MLRLFLLEKIEITEIFDFNLRKLRFLRYDGGDLRKMRLKFQVRLIETIKSQLSAKK